MRELGVQAVLHIGFGWLVTMPLMGPIIRGNGHSNVLRLIPTMAIAWTMSLKAGNWEVPCKPFHEAMAQPAPHGSYLRTSLKEHFPVWWNKVSASLHENGHSLPEMNEYDEQTKIPRTHTRFDATFR